jgi:hypothetical protein
LYLILDMRNKLYIIFGVGRLGRVIVEALVSRGFRVLAVDINQSVQYTLDTTNNNVSFLCLSQDLQKQKQQLRDFLAQESAQPVAFHTFLYSTSDLQKWVELMGGFTSQLGFISTVLGYDRYQLGYKSDLIIDRTDPKIIPNLNPNYGGYVNNKMSLEIAAKVIENRTNIKFFIPETIHIMGKGWPLGCAASYGDVLFRRGDLLDFLRQGVIYIPFAGENNMQGIHQNDLALLIALGMEFNFYGNYPLISPEVWTPKMYYQKIAKLINLKKIIIEKADLENVKRSLMMTLSHRYSTNDLLQKYTSLGYEWTSVNDCLEEMVSYYEADSNKPIEKRIITNLQETDINRKMNMEPLADPYKL